MADFKIKVCGMTDPANVEEVGRLKPDYMGFIFYSRSLRFVGHTPDPELFTAVPGDVKKVAVFVNEYYERMIELTVRHGIDHIQLHGMESPETCKSLKNSGMKVIKVFPGDQLENNRLLHDYADVADYFLFDTPVRSYGGSGRKFDWTNLKRLKAGKRFFLSGGISVEDAEPLKKLHFPDLYAIDINSRFEERPGVKNPGLIESLFKKLDDEK